MGSGPAVDRRSLRPVGRKWLIAAGMWVQAVGLVVVAIGETFEVWVVAAVLLGAGTAMVYPTLPSPRPPAWSWP